MDSMVTYEVDFEFATVPLVFLNGERMYAYQASPSESGIRRLFVDNRESPTVILKVDDPAFESPQSHAEWELWNLLDDEDRPFFAPCLAAGTLDWNGEPTEWVLMEYLDFDSPDWTPNERYHWPSLRRYRFSDPGQREAWNKVTRLVHKYELQDIAPRQFKFLKGTMNPVIHDYGANPFCPWWDERNVHTD